MLKPGTTDYKRERNAALYDRLNIVIPKGLKGAVEAHAKRKGESVNGLVNELLRTDMNISECDWKPQTEKPAAPPADAQASAPTAQLISKPRTMQELWALQSRMHQEEPDEEHIPLPWE